MSVYVPSFSSLFKDDFIPQHWQHPSLVSLPVIRITRYTLSKMLIHFYGRLLIASLVSASLSTFMSRDINCDSDTISSNDVNF